MNIPFVGPCYTGRSTYWDGQDTVNLFLETDSAGGKSSVAMVRTPGMVEFATLNAQGGEVRGVKPCGDGCLYAVCGNTLYKVTSAAVVTTIGTLESSTGQVSMSQNGDQLLIADGEYGYLLTLATGSFAKIVDANFPGASIVEFVDGYFAILKPDSEQWFLSDQYDGSSYDGITWASAQGEPDKLVCIAANHRNVWLFGEETTDVFYNSAADPPEFPFDRISGAFFETGCAAAHSVAQLDNTLFWLTNNLQVVRANGYSPQIVSTRQIEYLISQYVRADDAQAMTFVQGGHAFYALTFPTADVTWVYDAASNAWHRRKSYDMGRWRANCYASFNGMHIVGDMTSGKLYQLSETVYTEDGATIERIRVTAPLSAEGKRLFLSSLQVDFEPGVGTFTGQGADPQAMLQWSDDGGKTWSSEYWASIGKVGEYSARTIWRRLGSFRSRQFKLTITDPVNVVILGAYADIIREG